MLRILQKFILNALFAVFASHASAMFISPDPMNPTERGVGTNRYSYSFNDPINLSDPSGLAAIYKDTDGDGLNGYYGQVNPGEPGYNEIACGCPSRGGMSGSDWVDYNNSLKGAFTAGSPEARFGNFSAHDYWPPGAISMPANGLRGLFGYKSVLPADVQGILQNPTFARAHLDYLEQSTVRGLEAGFSVYAGPNQISATSDLNLVPFAGNFLHANRVDPGALPNIPGQRVVGLNHTHWRGPVHHAMVNLYAGPAPNDITALRHYMGLHPTIQAGFVGHSSGVHTFIPR